MANTEGHGDVEKGQGMHVHAYVRDGKETLTGNRQVGHKVCGYLHFFFYSLFSINRLTDPENCEKLILLCFLFGIYLNIFI